MRVPRAPESSDLTQLPAVHPALLLSVEDSDLSYSYFHMAMMPHDSFFTVPATTMVPPSSAPFAAGSIAPQEIPPGLPPAAVYQPYVSFDDLDPEMVLKLASQLPVVAPEIPSLWDNNLERLRSVYIDGVPPEVSNTEIIQLVSAGALEKIRRFVEKRYVILIFLKYESALRFYAEFFLNSYRLRGQSLNIGWVSTPPIAPEIRDAVDCQNASRNVYIEQHSGKISRQMEREAELRKDLTQFGTIETIHSLPHRNITFVYFTNILSAVKAVKELRQRSSTGDSKWKNFTIAFGKDPCQSLLKLKKQAALLYLGRSPYDTTSLSEYDQATVSKAIAYQSMAAVLVASISGGDMNIGNRCIYIGNCPSNTKLVDICNTVRGGMIEKIRFFGERGICFVTFLEACAAAQFYATYRLNRLLINGKPVKVGWGKHSGPLDPEIERAISRGVTRNVCIKDARPRYHSHQSPVTEEEIIEKFAEFGPIEQIKMAPELGCIFITFVCISKTMKAVEWAKANKIIPNTHIQYGKDRCATFPRFLTNRDSHDGDCGSGDNEKSRDPILIQFLRRELSRLIPIYFQRQLHPLPYIGPAFTAAPLYYAFNPYCDGSFPVSAPMESSNLNITVSEPSQIHEKEPDTRCGSTSESE